MQNVQPKGIELLIATNRYIPGLCILCKSYTRELPTGIRAEEVLRKAFGSGGMEVRE